jgi:hypothetical protein
MYVSKSINIQKISYTNLLGYKRSFNAPEIVRTNASKKPFTPLTAGTPSMSRGEDPMFRRD